MFNELAARKTYINTHINELKENVDDHFTYIIN